ncbi:SurA N-terminal domain-containing protein [Halopseudomonas maritima]|uniref:SurA N-terminal domain-containing protein n=1 Tax=Halopseudomonas maritima TaxID=2918528 RepID=UPI001EE9D72C|nr:SurA N-terminal domain-containing protein [Halopseudomonas maritima]UJJ33466.1 SurA N-terminal domain-containing protein [Halopseudomonas maritima]
MLQTMRDNAQSWVAKVIVGVIVLIFALTGWESISRFTNDAETAAEVNGQTITKLELEQAVAQQKRQLVQQLQQMGNQFDPSMIDDAFLRSSVLDGLIERAVLLQGAEDAGFQISDQMIDQLILSTPDFQVDGKFDANRFDVVIRNMGMPSRMAFRDLVRQQMMITQYRNGYEATAFATPKERQQLVALENQTRDFAVINVPVGEVDAQVSDEEVETYYNDNASQFMTPEQVVLETLTLKRASFFDQVQVDEQAVEELYQREIGNLAEQRRASHILVEVADDDAAAKEKIDAAAARIAAGEDFAAVAAEVSEDTGSSRDGGDLGYIVKGSFDDAFDDALFALQPDEVSAPVRSTYGYHLIKLTDLKAPEVPSLDSMREELVQELKVQQVERRFVEASQELANLAHEAPDLAEPAAALGVSVETLGPVERLGGEGLAANPKVMNAAFSEDVLKNGFNSELLELDADTVAVVRVKEHLEPSQRPLAEVSSEIREQLAFAKAEQAAAERATALAAQLREQTLSSDAVAEQLAAEWQLHEAAARAEGDIDPALLRQVFALPKPAADKPVYASIKQPAGGYWLVSLRGVATAADVQSAEGAPDQYALFVAGQSGQQDFAAAQQQLRTDADIERH